MARVATGTLRFYQGEEMNWLCWIGFHKWSPWGEFIKINKYDKISYGRYCFNCNAIHMEKR